MCSRIRKWLDDIELRRANYQWQIDRNSKLKDELQCPHYDPLQMTPEIIDEWIECGKEHRRLTNENQTLNNELWLLQKEKSVYSLVDKVLRCQK